MVIGMEVETLTNGIAKVIEVVDKDWCIVEFDNGFTKRTSRRSLKDGEIKNPYSKSVFGVGILGEGYKCSADGKMTNEYKVWVAMISRCYSGYDRYCSYQDTHVCEDWLSFQVFAEWCQGAKGFNLKGWQPDKDLLIPHNKLYSSETCCFLPISINASISQLSLGTCFQKGVSYNESTKRYHVSFYDSDRNTRTTRSFICEEEAFQFYMRNRFNKLRIEFDKYGDKLDDRAMKRLSEMLENS